jgi:hypothetical protein
MVITVSFDCLGVGGEIVEGVGQSIFSVNWDEVDDNVRGVFRVYNESGAEVMKTYHAFCVKQVLRRVLEVEEEKDNLHNWHKQYKTKRVHNR